MTFIVYIILFYGVIFSLKTPAISNNEIDSLADLTAIYMFLKYDCGYTQIPDSEIEKVIFYLAKINHWDISNYNQDTMIKANKEHYDDLKKIPISSKKKCQVLADNALVLFTYIK